LGVPNRILNKDELAKANALLDQIRQELDALADEDHELLFAYRRKIAKMLTYDERSGPMVRRKLKATKRREQNGLCPICSQTLPERYTVLDRFWAADGYTSKNTRLICETCDRDVQAKRGYT
jgi:DNA repair exonuclease SbcCD ATPase subunit